MRMGKSEGEEKLSQLHNIWRIASSCLFAKGP